MRPTQRSLGARARFSAAIATGALTVFGVFAAPNVASADPGGKSSVRSANAADVGADRGNGNGNGNSNDGKGNGKGTTDASVGSGPVEIGAVTASTATVAGDTASVLSVVASATSHGSSGTLTSPQPLSGADQNAGGANNNGNCGAYCSTRNGDASGNGNGGGNAVGRPCAGCVGKADNKNPPGQYKDGNDHNNGYECDGNHGIARTNPAHTGCNGVPPDCTKTNSCPNPCPPGSAHTTKPCDDPPCPPGSAHTTKPCDDPPCPPGSAHTTKPCGDSDCTKTGSCPPPDCTTTGTCPQTCSATGSCPPPDCTTTGTCPQTCTGADCTPPPPECVASAANGFCSAVLGEKITNTSTPATPTQVLGEQLQRLPFTGPGFDVRKWLLGGLAMMLWGALACVFFARSAPRRIGRV